MADILNHRINDSHSPMDRAVAPQPFDFSMSLFSGVGMVYSVPSQTTSYGYNSYVEPGNTFDTLSSYSHRPAELVVPFSSLIPNPPNMPPYTPPTRGEIWGSPHNKAEFQYPPQEHTPVHLDGAVSGNDGGGSLGTGVDTLMRTIQTKPLSATYDSSTNVVLGCQDGNGNMTLSAAKLDTQDDPGCYGKQSKRTYQCDIISCAKGFLQKTHLDIQYACPALEFAYSPSQTCIRLVGCP